MKNCRITHAVIVFTCLIAANLCAPPDLSTSLPDSFTLLESASPSGTSLLDITVTDPEGDTYSCTVSGASGAFYILNTAANTESIYLNNNPGFEHDTTPSYTLTVTCTDANGESSTGTVTVIIQSNTSPTFSASSVAVSVNERETTSQSIYALTVTDTDPFTCSIASTNPPGAPFVYQSSPSRAIFLNANPGLDASVTASYLITISCADAYGSSTADLTVNVVPNSAPVFTGLPTSVSVLESAAGGTIYTITVSDPDGDTVSCSRVNSPATSDIYLNGATKKIELVSGHSLEYDTQDTYTVTITCTDGRKSSAGTLTVNVQPNSPPSITNLPATSTVTEGEAGGRNLLTLTVTDAESDTFSCSITTTGPFSISGLIVSLNAAPTLDYGTMPSYSIPVTCNDAYGSTTETLTVNVLQNAAPVISAMPASVSVQESDAGGSSIYTLTVTDTDAFSCVIQSTTPASGPFTMVYTTQYDVHLNSGHSLDFDSVPSYVLIIACTDGTSTSTDQLTVTVQQNAPPDITSLSTTVGVTADETAKRLLHDLVVTDTDPFSCTMTGGGPFSLEKVGTDFKVYLDAGASSSMNYATTPTYSLSVTCADAYGSTTKVLTVNVSPNAAPSITNLPDAVTVVESDAGGSSIFTVTVSDVENDAFACSIQSVTPAVSAFQIAPNGANYDINLISGHALEYDTSSSHDVVVECNDGTASTGTLTVNVSPNAAPDITSLLATATVTNGETAARTLHTLAVTDAEGDTFVCTETTVPAGGPFSLTLDGTTYKVNLNSNPSFGATTSYTMTVKCEDNFGSSSKDLVISVDPNTDPSITGLPVTVTVSETETAARCLHTLAVSDADNHVITCSVTSTPAGPFEMQQDASIPEYKICLSANAIDTLDAVTSNTHDVSVTCTDSAGGSVNDHLFVTVTADNPPAITALPDVAEVSENLQVETKVWDLAVTDPEGDVFTCNLTTTPNGPFDLRKDTATGAYSAYLLSTPNLNYSLVQSYDLTFLCADYPKGRYSSNTLTVNVVENRPPQFDNTPYTATPNAMTVTQNDVIFTVTASDLDLDTVLYSMTLPSPSAPFTINSVSGEISATSDLKYQLTKTFIANVTATDGKKSTWELVTIDLQNVNTAPVISNMVLNGITSVYIPETTASGSALFTATVYDPDGGQTQTISYDVYPSGMYGTFSENNKVISLAAGKTFDYEDLRYYKLALYVTDSFAQTGPYYLAVNVLDEPEDCIFPKANYKAETYEGGKASVYVDLGLKNGVTDQDDPDPPTYSLVNTAYSNLFNISSTTGVIYYAVDYDIDVAHPQNLTLVVKCTDKYGLTATASVSLYIADVNDNAPDFTSVGYVFYVSQYTDPGDLIGTIDATDRDQYLNAEVEYSGTSATGSGYYSVAKNGQIHLTKSINFDYGTTHRFRVVAVDHGTPQLTGTSWVDIIYREITTTTPTTTTEPNTDWWSKPENVAMVAILSALALLLLALLLYFCIRSGCCGTPSCRCPEMNCFKDCCKTEPTRSVKEPKKPKPEKFKLWDANDLNKKRDPYSTAAQKEMEAMPEPMVL